MCANGDGCDVDTLDQSQWKVVPVEQTKESSWIDLVKSPSAQLEQEESEEGAPILPPVYTEQPEPLKKRIKPAELFSVPKTGGWRYNKSIIIKREKKRSWKNS